MILDVIFGAGVGSFLSNLLSQYAELPFRRARRDEELRDTECERCCEILKSIVNDSERYWASSSFELGREELVLSARINASLFYLNKQINEFLRGHQKLLELSSEEWGALFELATGGDFKSSERSRNENVLQEIYLSAYSLESGLRIRRKKLKRRWFW